jgi:hypothetical protein
VRRDAGLKKYTQPSFSQLYSNTHAVLEFDDVDRLIAEKSHLKKNSMRSQPTLLAESRFRLLVSV